MQRSREKKKLLKRFFKKLLTREKSFGIILNPVAMNATPPEEKILKALDKKLKVLTIINFVSSKELAL